MQGITVERLTFEFDPSQTNDFRWPYFGSLCVQGMGLAVRQAHAQKAWTDGREKIINLEDAKKETRRTLAAVEATVRGNLSDDDPNLKDKKTKDEREAYRAAMVQGTAEWQEAAAFLAGIEKEIALLETETEAWQKTWRRCDRVLSFFERVMGCLSTFAPQSETGQAVVAGQFSSAVQQAAQALTGQGSGPPEIPEDGPYYGPPPIHDSLIDDDPPPGFEIDDDGIYY